MFKNIETNNRLGIWMDHATANLIAYSDVIEGLTIDLKFTHQNKMSSPSHGESGMNQKEHHLQEAYYKQISAEILKYDSVLLFGPTNAKNELNNYLLKDHHFNEIIFKIKKADKMSSNDQRAFVKNYFDKCLY
jgi:stalled ribosome rescue protein Dom34